jgi:predicted RNase H-like nuclease (RuvC/YqgF family)
MSEATKVQAREILTQMVDSLAPSTAVSDTMRSLTEARLLINAYTRAIDSLGAQVKAFESEVAHTRRELAEQAQYIEELQHRPERKNKRPII